jgi:hypothetical protein
LDGSVCVVFRVKAAVERRSLKDLKNVNLGKMDRRSIAIGRCISKTTIYNIKITAVVVDSAARPTERPGPLRHRPQESRVKDGEPANLRVFHPNTATIGCNRILEERFFDLDAMLLSNVQARCLCGV